MNLLRLLVIKGYWCIREKYTRERKRYDLPLIKRETIFVQMYSFIPIHVPIKITQSWKYIFLYPTVKTRIRYISGSQPVDLYLCTYNIRRLSFEKLGNLFFNKMKEIKIQYAMYIINNNARGFF